MTVRGFDRYKPLMQLWIHWARLLFTPLSLLVIAVFVWRSRASIFAVAREGDPLLLLTAVLLWVAINLLAPVVSMSIFRTTRISMPYHKALFIHCSRLPAKYLPGGIWHSVGRANDYLGLGHGRGKVGFYFIVENFLLVAVTLCLGSAIVWPLVGIPALQGTILWLSVFLAFAMLLFPWAVKLITKGQQTLSTAAYFVALVLLIVYWTLAGLAFACYLSAFGGLALSVSLVEVVGVYIFSWSVGYISLFAPQGIGVAEFVSGSLLGDGGGPGQIVGFLVGFRLLVLAADLLSWFLSGVMKTRR